MDLNGMTYCDMEISLGVQIPEVGKNAAFTAICAGYKDKINQS